MSIYEERDDYPEDEEIEQAEPSDEEDLDEDALDGEEEDEEPVAGEADPEAVFLKALGRLRATDTPTSPAYLAARKAWFVFKAQADRVDLMKVYASPAWQVLRAIYDRTPERKKAKKERDAARWIRSGRAKRAARRASMAVQRHSRVITLRLVEVALVGADVKTLAGSLAREAVRVALKTAVDRLAAGKMSEDEVQPIVMQYEAMFGGPPPAALLEAARAARAARKETT